MMVDAAKAVGVGLLIWSALESVSGISKGKYVHVDHFDGKADITAYAHASGVPLIIAQNGWYATNHMLLDGFVPRKDPEADGAYVLALPMGEDTIVPIIDAARDYGLFVREAIESPAFGPGSEVLASGEDISLRDMCAQLSQKSRYKRISDEEFMAATKQPHRIALEFLENAKFCEEFGYFGDKDTKPSREHLSRTPRTWADFVRATDWSSILV
ncbi:hypothetical protein B0H17DRAFT_1085722 [Mycena rosella]|uniref:NmrA-like domain-containing protein n=1 Tax=Mycena rosella TaxID=1033263 RepID=A0AAD7CZ47_MYCRO|nr:hypothetical protein B0H17DRAFT_1085722 [Mycena rosella]